MNYLYTVSNLNVELLDSEGKVISSTSSGPSGHFTFMLKKELTFDQLKEYKIEYTDFTGQKKSIFIKDHPVEGHSYEDFLFELKPFFISLDSILSLDPALNSSSPSIYKKNIVGSGQRPNLERITNIKSLTNEQ
jgi:hypothetical protein